MNNLTKAQQIALKTMVKNMVEPVINREMSYDLLKRHVYAREFSRASTFFICYKAVLLTLMLCLMSCSYLSNVSWVSQGCCVVIVILGVIDSFCRLDNELFKKKYMSEQALVWWKKIKHHIENETLLDFYQEHNRSVTQRADKKVNAMLEEALQQAKKS